MLAGNLISINFHAFKQLKFHQVGELTIAYDKQQSPESLNWIEKITQFPFMIHLKQRKQETKNTFAFIYNFCDSRRCCSPRSIVFRDDPISNFIHISIGFVFFSAIH